MNKIKEQVIEKLIDHSRIIYSVISDLGVYYSLWAENYEISKDNLEKKKIKMTLSEEDADAIKIDVIKNFSEAGAQGLGDYIALVLRMDNVINYAIEFVDILTTIDYNIRDEIKQRYHKLINKLIEMADTLKMTIKSLRDNPKDTFGYTTQVHEIENSIDKIYREFLTFIYEDENLDIRKLLKIRDSINNLEQMADRIHDIADVIRVLHYQ